MGQDYILLFIIINIILYNKSCLWRRERTLMPRGPTKKKRRKKKEGSKKDHLTYPAMLKDTRTLPSYDIEIQKFRQITRE